MCSICCALAGERGSLRLENHARFVQVAQRDLHSDELLHIDALRRNAVKLPRYERTAPAPHLQKSFGSERADRLAQGRAADAERLGKLVFIRQLFARTVFLFFQNLRTQRFGGALGKVFCLHNLPRFIDLPVPLYYTFTKKAKQTLKLLCRRSYPRHCAKGY